MDAGGGIFNPTNANHICIVIRCLPAPHSSRQYSFYRLGCDPIQNLQFFVESHIFLFPQKISQSFCCFPNFNLDTGLTFFFLIFG